MQNPMKSARAFLSMTQLQLAAELGLSASTVQRMEADRDQIDRRTEMALRLLVLEKTENKS